MKVACESHKLSIANCLRLALSVPCSKVLHKPLLRSRKDSRYRSVRGGSNLKSSFLSNFFSLIPVGFVKESSDAIDGLMFGMPGSVFSLKSGLTAAAMLRSTDLINPQLTST